jgi:hypothetical protein
MSYYSHSEEVPPAPLEVIGDLIYAPGTDLPFGKNVRIGPKDEIIYDSVIERGYQAGIEAHHAFLRDHNSSTPVVLDDKQFTMIIKHLVPKNIPPFEKGLWRSFFIVGWTCVYLGVETPMNE